LAARHGLPRLVEGAENMSRLRSSVGLAVGLAILAAVALAAGAVPSGAAGFFEKNFWLSGPRYDADVPLCEEAAPLDTIQDGFAAKEGRFWNSTLAIVGFEKVRQVAFRPWNADAIPRRFCQAVALVSDGKKRPVYYSISEDGGFASIGFGVDWCVVGLDRNLAYNPACRMARP
jgi:hypothetical protein